MTRRRTLAEATVELTPLIDVVFLLLIFFLVSASFIGETQLDIELPAASGAPRAMDAATVQVAVRRDGTYQVSGTPVAGDSAAALAAALTEAKTNLEPKPVRLAIAADARATHQAVVRALEAAADVGLTRISIMTRSPGESAPPGLRPSGAEPAPREASRGRDAG